MAAAFLAQARAGRPIEALLRDPAMPSRAVFRSWLAQSPPFAAAVAEVRALLAAEAARRRGRAYREYDPVIGERIYVRRGGAAQRPAGAAAHAAGVAAGREGRVPYST